MVTSENWGSDMSFYPDVSPGDRFVPNAQLSNDIRHLVNAAHGFQDCRQKGVPFGSVRVSVYNATEETIPSNTAVVFTSDVTKGDTLPVKQAPAGTAEFGIVTRALAPNECGSCILIGTATVAVAEGTGNFAKPSDTRIFIRASTGTAKILHSSETKAVILLGGSQPQAAAQVVSGYAGAFAVKNNGDGTVSIYNAAKPDDTKAGTIRIGSNVFDIDVGTVTLSTSGTTRIYITVSYSGNNIVVNSADNYVFEYTNRIPQNADTRYQFWYKELASVDTDGALRQTHLCGNIEIAGRWCW